MSLQKFERSQWTDVCAAVSIGLLGKRAEIEVVSPVDGILIEAQWPPVIGIAYDPANDALKIMLDVNAPASTRVRAADNVLDHAKQAIELEDIEARVALLEEATEKTKPHR